MTTFSKIFERVIKLRLANDLEGNKILLLTKIDFGKGHNTESAITSLTHSILHEIDKKKKTIVIFMDLSKAFGSVCHIKLINYLDKIGTNNKELGLFKS